MSAYKKQYLDIFKNTNQNIDTIRSHIETIA